MLFHSFSQNEKEAAFLPKKGIIVFYVSYESGWLYIENLYFLTEIEFSYVLLIEKLNKWISKL